MSRTATPSSGSSSVVGASVLGTSKAGTISVSNRTARAGSTCGVPTPASTAWTAAPCPVANSTWFRYWRSSNATSRSGSCPSENVPSPDKAVARPTNTGAPSGCSSLGALSEKRAWNNHCSSEL